MTAIFVLMVSRGNFTQSASDKVRILVLGDSGVGKTSLIHLFCHEKVINNAPPTIGCYVDVKVIFFITNLIQSYTNTMINLSSLSSLKLEENQSTK